MIQYQPLTSQSLEHIKALHEQHGWLAYLTDDEKLKRALAVENMYRLYRKYYPIWVEQKKNTVRQT